jgi:hypothetical protein
MISNIVFLIISLFLFGMEVESKTVAKQVSYTVFFKNISVQF